MNNRRQELFVCDCGDIAHQMVFTFDDDPDWRGVYVEFHLNKGVRWWKRIWIAIKYIFGHQSRFGAFDEVILQKKDAERLQEVVDFLKTAKN